MSTVQELRTSPEIGGVGHSVLRKEDDRFIRGAGSYIDDLTLPGMLHMAILRSPVAHARIGSIDSSAATALDGVLAVVTGEALAAHGLAWMPTLSGDTQAVLATDKVRFQGQEVAAVIAADPYTAADAVKLIEVEYEDLEAITTPQQSLSTDTLIRDDKEGQTDNTAYTWEAGDQDAADAAFAAAARVVSLDTHYPRSHPAPLETCGVVADVNSITGQATIYMTSQAPHAIRTVFALVAGLPEEKIRIVTRDIGGGFGNKVPVYPGYVVATAASLLIGKPVKWIESRTENLISTGFARDFHMHAELAIDGDNRITAMRADILSDQGAFYSDAQPSKFRAGLFHICTGSYDFPAAHVTAKGAYTNKAPGGVAYRCSFRVTEASYLIERLVDNAAHEVGMDPADFRSLNFIGADQFPYLSPTGFVYDSGDYHGAMDMAKELIDYDGWRARQAEQNSDPGADKLIGIGIASFTEVVGAGNSREFDILGLKMFDSAELRVHPTGKAILKLGVQTQGQGHETTFAQIVAEELGIPYSDIKVQYGDTDNTPYGLGTYASRSTPVGGAATAVVSRKLRAKARKLAAHLLEAAEEDLERMGTRQVHREGHRPERHHPGRGLRRLHQPPRGDGGGPRRRDLLRPPQHDVPLRHLYRGGGGGHRRRHLEGVGHGGGGRLRGAHQPDDRGRPDHRGADRRVRQGQHAVDHLRRRRQLHRVQFHGLPGADRLGDPPLQTGRDRHPVAPPSDRGQGRGRVGHGGLPGRLHQRGGGRAPVAGRYQHRHAGAPAPGVGRPQRGGCEPLTLRFPIRLGIGDEAPE